MKTTIKLTTFRSMTVQPCKAGGVVVEITDRVFDVSSTDAIHLTPDQMGALIFALEMCIEGSPETLNDRG